MPTLHLMVGLPGAGKTTEAIRLARDARALRLTPDEWLVPMLGTEEPGRARDALEGRMLWTATEVLRNGGSVVVDFGCWGEDERWAVRSLAQTVGVEFELHLVEAEPHVRRARAVARWTAEPASTYPMTEEEHARAEALFQPVTDTELAGGPIPGPPEPFTSWPAWASTRWPSLPIL